ncbi:MAG: YdcF family protein [Pseudomonadota bacterium]
MDDLFFLASKILWALARPETILLVLFGIGMAIWVFGRSRAAAWVLGLAFVSLVAVGTLPLGALMLSPLENRFPPRPEVGLVEGIIILGGGETPAHTAAWGEPQVIDAGDRFLSALALAESHPGAWVMFAGGSGQIGGSVMPESEVARALLLGAGLAPDRLILEPKSRNTIENAENALALRPESAGGTVLLVTSAWHMPRAVASFCAAGWAGVTPWPTDYRTLPGGRFRPRLNLAGNLLKLNLATKEWIGLAAYRILGRTDAIHVDADCAP